MSLTSSKIVETNRVEMEISVDAQQFEEALAKAYRKGVQKVSLPGFRKGKAPRSMIEKMYGKDFFYEDAINAIYPVAYEEAVTAAGIEPVDRADVTDLKVEEEGKGFHFKASVTVKPSVEIKDYKGIQVEKLIETVMAAEVNAELEKMRGRSARLITVEDRAAKLQDTATIDFEGFREGVAFEGGKGEGVALELGAHQFIEGFEEQIVGKKVGEEFEVNVTFPENYHVEELAGQPARFQTKLISLQEKELPALDDEFAKDVSEFDTLADLKKDLKEKLQKSADQKAQADVENAMMTTLIENMTVEIPACMVENKISEMVNDFAYRLQSQGMNMEMYLQYTGMEMPAFRETFQAPADRQVRVRLALEKISELEKLEASEEEIASEYEKLAKNYGIEVEKVKGFLPEKEIQMDVVVTKAIEIVRSTAVVTEKKVKKAAKAKKAKTEDSATPVEEEEMADEE